MALPYDQISATTEKKFIPKLIDNVFDSDPLLQRSKKKGWYKKIDGGERIVEPLAYAQNGAGGWYTGAETLSTTDNDPFSGAEYHWKQLYENISITRLDELKNSGDSQIIDLVKEKVKLAEKTMADRLGTGLYSAGTDAKSIVGLRVLVKGSGSAGGISGDTYSWWTSTEDASTTTLTMAALQGHHTTLTINNESPSVILATRANYNRYYALLQPQQRFMDEETAKGGFQSLMFNGTPFIAGSKVPSGHVLFINESYLALRVHKDEDMRFEAFQKPINQNVKVAKLYWMGALTVNNRRMHGLFTSISA